MPDARALMVKIHSFSADDRVRQIAGLSPEERVKYDELSSARKSLPKPSAAQKPRNAPVKGKVQKHGRWEMLNNWVDYGQRQFTPAECVVWLTIFRMADGKNHTVEFGLRALAERAGLNKNTASRAVTKLVKAGVLSCIFKSQTAGTPSKYRLEDATTKHIDRGTRAYD